MSTPVLRLDTSYLDGSELQAEPTLSPVLQTPETRNRVRGLSQSVIPSFRIPASPTAEKFPTDIASYAASHGSDKARFESRKLLAHILEQLQDRQSPPSQLYGLTHPRDRTSKRLSSASRSSNGPAKHQRGRSDGRNYRPVPTDDSDSDSDNEEKAIYTTDSTLDLMNKLREVLVMAANHQWDILNDSSMFVESRSSSEKSKDSFRRRRSGGSGRRNRSHSRTQSATSEVDGPTKAPHLLMRCLSILASIVKEDCRYRVASPRPSKPPYALQAVTLDIAQLVIFLHRDDAHTVSQVALAVIPAFYTFGARMHGRLLAFFHHVVLGHTLNDVRQTLENHNPRGLFEPAAPPGGTAEAHAPMVSIRVDEVTEPDALQSRGWHRWITSGASLYKGLCSTSAPAQDVSVYHFTSLISPLLAAILDNIDPLSEDLPTLHRLHQVLCMMAEYKPDAYLDVLSVIAYHTAGARFLAISVLMTYWPRTIGHVVVSKAFPVLSYSTSLARVTQGLTVTRKPHDHPYAHQFVPWRFNSQLIPGVFTQHECRSCMNAISGFGLLCPLCMCTVHFDCYDYPEGSHLSQYSISGQDTQKLAVYRYCYIPQRRDISTPIMQGNHSFRLINLFSLTLCFICHQPLWGCVAQAYRCGSCKQFAHASCLNNASSSLPRCRSVAVDETLVTMEWSAMRSSFADYYGDFPRTETEVINKSYEEVSTLAAVLWLQLQILLNGVALGSIVLSHDANSGFPAQDTQLVDFELQEWINLYDHLISSNKLTMSDALTDHFAENHLKPAQTSIYFDWRVLTFITSTIKLPPSAQHTNFTSTDLLGVTPPELDEQDPQSSFPLETFTFAHLRNQMGELLRLCCEPAARHMLTHLAHLGFVQTLDAHEVTFNDDMREDLGRVLCFSPLPLGLDMSTEVETLVSAIEACLSDLDISANEAGFLMLVRKFWPDGMLTDYALHRLCAAVITWIISEDRNLAAMLRDYVAKGQSLPGVRSGTEIQSWPSQLQPRAPVANSANNGGDYVSSRRVLLSRYASKWLLALHDMDIDNYAAVIFDILEAQAMEDDVRDEYFLGKESDDRELKRRFVIADKILGSIIKLSQASILYTAFDDIIKAWMTHARDLSLNQQPLSSLSRLFNRETESGNRFTSILDPRYSAVETTELATGSVLRLLIDTATESTKGFQCSIHWLCLFMRSGVDIPVSTFMEFAQLAQRYDATLNETSAIIRAALWSTWLRSVGRQEIQGVVVTLHSHIYVHLIDSLRLGKDTKDIVRFVRQSLAICLLAFGCERSYIHGVGMLQSEETEGLPSRRKLHARTTTMADPVTIDAGFMNILRAYVEAKVDEVSCFVAKFLNAFINDAPFMETYEVDNFILRNGDILCTCMWQFYGSQIPELSMIRPAFMLRVLVVDTHPFQTLIDGLFSPSNHWELRLQGALRLFRMVLDVTSPYFDVEGRQWRTSATIIFQRFFSRLWMDDSEEVRLAVETWSKTLLEAHLDAIALCWNDSLAKSPISDRIKLVSFLNQLHPHFSTWPVLPWELMIEIFFEHDYVHKSGDGTGDSVTTHAESASQDAAVSEDAELSVLRVSLLSLAIRMVTHGIPIEPNELVKIKGHMVRVLGFQEIYMVPTPSGRGFHFRFSGFKSIPESAEACIDDLMLILDSPQTCDISPSMVGGPYADDETPSTLLVGSVFVDILFGLFDAVDILELPSITLKNMLKSFMIILYKHDLDSRPLKHLQGPSRKAIRQVLNLIRCDLSYELRQLALSTCQVFIKRWPTIINNMTIDAVEESAQLMVDLKYESNSDNILVDQLRSFIATTFTMLASGGIFIALCKRRLNPEFFTIIRYITTPNARINRSPQMQESLKDVLLRDTLARSFTSEPEDIRQIVENVSAYIETVHHTGLSADMMQAVGNWLTGIARRTAEWTWEVFDASPLFLLACVLIQHNKSQSRDLLLYMETLLRATLIRCKVSVDSLKRIIEVTSQLYRRAASASSPNADGAVVNPITSAMIETISDAARGRTRVISESLIALLDAMDETVVANLLSGKISILPDTAIYGMANDAVLMLTSDNLIENYSETSFGISRSAAKFVLDVAEYQPAIMNRLSRLATTVRVWNIIALAALESNRNASAAVLLQYFSTFISVYYQSLATFQRPQGGPEVDTRTSTHKVISGAYAAIKLWLLVARGASARRREIRDPLSGTSDAQTESSRNEENLAMKMVWNELWPPFGRVLSVLEADAHEGHVSLLTSTIWASVADLLLFLRQSRSVALNASSEANILDRLRAFTRNESRLARVVRNMNEPPPDVPLDFFVGQIASDLAAEERLHAAKLYDSLPDRNRRIVS
ncbi:hypothetical protein WOLCODRAFT_136025 [Wolfiporia cocos MD-104 SS10]|uniref:Phorbol-ester/DAG-type domain-containing protein n=1 Tax=Wolfiporia cocos (strain MD-104) TaxID=742152 RepID=A0A2H3J8V6_WOLCO|nr:hypothetical protein WOLCODRAFT_136025 [Wolfiporia cocos MD-104 SS10]